MRIPLCIFALPRRSFRLPLYLQAGHCRGRTSVDHGAGNRTRCRGGPARARALAVDESFAGGAGWAGRAAPALCTATSTLSSDIFCAVSVLCLCCACAVPVILCLLICVCDVVSVLCPVRCVRHQQHHLWTFPPAFAFLTATSPLPGAIALLGACAGRVLSHWPVWNPMLWPIWGCRPGRCTVPAPSMASVPG